MIKKNQRPSSAVHIEEKPSGVQELLRLEEFYEKYTLWHGLSHKQIYGVVARLLVYCLLFDFD